MRNTNDLLTLSGTDLSVSITSEAVPCNLLLFTGQQIKISAATALNGVFNVQASLDETATPVNWTTVDSQTVTALSGAIVYLKGQQNIPYNYMRILWSPTSGSGTLSEIRFQGKGF